MCSEVPSNQRCGSRGLGVGRNMAVQWEGRRQWFYVLRRCSVLVWYCGWGVAWAIGSYFFFINIPSAHSSLFLFHCLWEAKALQAWNAKAKPIKRVELPWLERRSPHDFIRGQKVPYGPVGICTGLGGAGSCTEQDTKPQGMTAGCSQVGHL
jgi:hypothetical protein